MERSILILLTAGMVWFVIWIIGKITSHKRKSSEHKQASESNRVQLYNIDLKKCVEASQLTDKGCTLADNGELDAALNCFKKAIKIKSDFFGANLGIARIFFDLGQYEAALEALERMPEAMEIGGAKYGSNNFTNFRLRAFVYSKLNNKEAAKNFAKKALVEISDPERIKLFTINKNLDLLLEDQDYPVIIQLKKIVGSEGPFYGQDNIFQSDLAKKNKLLIGTATIDTAAKLLVTIIFSEPELCKHFSLDFEIEIGGERATWLILDLPYKNFKEHFMHLFNDKGFLEMYHAVISYFLVVGCSVYKEMGFSDETMHELAKFVMERSGMLEEDLNQYTLWHHPEVASKMPYLYRLANQIYKPIFDNDVSKNILMAANITSTDKSFGFMEWFIKFIKSRLQQEKMNI